MKTVLLKIDCPECYSWLDEEATIEDADFVSKKPVRFVRCPHCGKHFVMTVDLSARSHKVPTNWEGGCQWIPV